MSTYGDAAAKNYELGRSDEHAVVLSTLRDRLDWYAEEYLEDTFTAPGQGWSGRGKVHVRYKPTRVHALDAAADLTARISGRTLAQERTDALCRVQERGKQL